MSLSIKCCKQSGQNRAIQKYIFLLNINIALKQRLLIKNNVFCHCASCLTYGKVCVFVCLGDGLDKVGRLAEMVGLQLLLQGSIRGLREQGLFLQYSQDSCAK
jgi:hypothetical protein